MILSKVLIGADYDFNCNDVYDLVQNIYDNLHEFRPINDSKQIYVKNDFCLDYEESKDIEGNPVRVIFASDCNGLKYALCVWDYDTNPYRITGTMNGTKIDFAY